MPAYMPRKTNSRIAFEKTANFHKAGIDAIREQIKDAAEKGAGTLTIYGSQKDKDIYKIAKVILREDGFEVSLVDSVGVCLNISWI